MIRAVVRSFFRFFYAYTSLLNRLLPDIELAGRSFRVFPGVYKPIENEQNLVTFIPDGLDVLDIGCGSGILTVLAALKSKHVTATDISDVAVENTRFNCEAHGLKNVTVMRSDMFEAIEGKFGAILCNAPFVKIDLEGDVNQWATSTRFVPTFFREAPLYLEEGGLVIVHQPTGDEERLKELGRANGFEMIASVKDARKDLRLHFLSFLYLSFGVDGSIYVFERNRDAPDPAEQSSNAGTS